MNTVDFRVKIAYVDFNSSALDEHIRKHISEGFLGISTYGKDAKEISVWIDEDLISEEDKDKIRKAVEDFDPKTQPTKTPSFWGNTKEEANVKLDSIDFNNKDSVKEVIKEILALLFNKG